MNDFHHETAQAPFGSLLLTLTRPHGEFVTCISRIITSADLIHGYAVRKIIANEWRRMRHDLRIARQTTT